MEFDFILIDTVIPPPWWVYLFPVIVGLTVIWALRD